MMVKKVESSYLFLSKTNFYSFSIECLNLNGPSSFKMSRIRQIKATNQASTTIVNEPTNPSPTKQANHALPMNQFIWLLILSTEEVKLTILKAPEWMALII